MPHLIYNNSEEKNKIKKIEDINKLSINEHKVEKHDIEEDVKIYNIYD
jgi:hypothetical protein